MDKIIISGLHARGILGVHAWERGAPRDILINATLFCDTHRAATSDDLSDCVDYSAISIRLRLHAENAARKTVEALANDLAAICLEDGRVVRVILRVEKPGALPDADCVGVEVDRGRID